VAHHWSDGYLACQALKGQGQAQVTASPAVSERPRASARGLFFAGVHPVLKHNERQLCDTCHSLIFSTDSQSHSLAGVRLRFSDAIAHPLLGYQYGTHLNTYFYDNDMFIHVKAILPRHTHTEC
jgi:hypothetical protein